MAHSETVQLRTKVSRLVGPAERTEEDEWFGLPNSMRDEPKEKASAELGVLVEQR